MFKGRLTLTGYGNATGYFKVPSSIGVGTHLHYTSSLKLEHMLASQRMVRVLIPVLKGSQALLSTLEIEICG